MDDSERQVGVYLRSLGYTNTIYEPDGNVPPDFLVDGAIAVEVRRLNQHYHGADGPEGLEQVAIPLWQTVQKMADAYGPPVAGVSWYVLMSYSRPLPQMKVLRSLIKAAMDQAAAETVKNRLDIDVTQTMRMKFVRSPMTKSTLFIMGGRMDQQSGGYLHAEIASNLQHCIAEKARKIAPMRHKYSEWWLVLPDHIGRGIDEFEQSFLKDDLEPQTAFDRVILVDPNNPTKGYRAY